MFHQRVVLLAWLSVVAAAGHAAVPEDAAQLEADGKHAEARALLEGYCREHPDDRTARIRLIHVMISAGAAKDAEPLVVTELARTPNDPPLQNEPVSYTHLTLPTSDLV